MTRTRSLVRAAGAAALAAALFASVPCATQPARAHEAAVLDLEALELHLFEALDDPGTPPLLHGAYARLFERFAPSSGGLLSKDVKKLLLAAKSCAGALADDAQLVALVDAAAEQADDALDGESDDLVEVERRVLSGAKRKAIARVATTAARLHAKAAAEDDRVRRLARFKRAATSFERARKLAAKALARQSRRPSPGQPLPKGPSGTIDTYVGNGLRGYDGEAGRALETALYWPLDVTVRPDDGLLYVCDANSHRVRRVDADGRLRTVVGSGFLGASEGPALEADIHHPADVVFEPRTGALVIAGWHAEVLQRLDPGTETLSFASAPGYGFSGDDGQLGAAHFSYPVSVAFDADGNWYVSDQANARIRRVDAATGVVTTFAGTGAVGDSGDDGDATGAELALDDGENLNAGGKVCTNPAGTVLYVADTLNRRVRGIDLATRTIFAVAGTGAAGSGDPVADGAGGAALTAHLTAPVDVDCDAAGDLYIADRGADVVWRVDAASGTLSVFAGTGVAGYRGDGGPATAARLDAPGGVHVDRDRGRVYIADTDNSVVRVVWE